MRLKVDLSAIALRRFRKACVDAGEESLIGLVEEVATKLGEGPHNDFNQFLEVVESGVGDDGVRMTTKRQKLLLAELGVKHRDAAPIIKKISKAKAGVDAEHEELFGSYLRTLGGKAAAVAYEPDTDLRDTEQVPFLEPGGIEAFVRREVLPHAPDAWIDGSKTVIGYEISFTRHFYKPQPLRTLEEIEADIRMLEKETDGLLEDVLVGGH